MQSLNMNNNIIVSGVNDFGNLVESQSINMVT